MPSIDNGQMFARQRELFYRADSNRAALWDAIGNTVSTLKAHGAKPQQVMQAIDQPLAALRKLTASPAVTRMLLRASWQCYLGGHRRSRHQCSRQVGLFSRQRQRRTFI